MNAVAWNRETDVACPECSEGILVVVIGCLSATVTCRDCLMAFSMSDLSARLDPGEFARLAKAVGDRASDRV